MSDVFAPKRHLFAFLYIFLLVFFFFSTSTGRQSTTKQQVALPFSDHYYCQSKYRALGITVTDNQLCAGGIYGSDTCDGDSGNGLLKVAANSWVIEGIVSYGKECGLPEWPAVYTKVSNYQNWIIRNLES